MIMISVTGFWPRLAAGLLAAGALYWVGAKIHGSIYDAGYAAKSEEIRLAQSQLDSQRDAVKTEDHKVERNIVTDYVEVEKKVFIKGETIIREIPIYVPSEASNGCVLPLGFISMFDRANQWAGSNDSQEDAAAADPDDRAAAPSSSL